MDSDKGLPIAAAGSERRRKHPKMKHLGTVLLILCLFSILFSSSSISRSTSRTAPPAFAADVLARCRALDARPGPPANFYLRTQSDRFQAGTPPTLIRNASIWTGDESNLVVEGDILLDSGIIKAVGRIDPDLLAKYAPSELGELDVHGAWVTPGIVDLHSHIGVSSTPALAGASDSNSLRALAQPWLRSIDGLNTHDLSYAHAVAGGVTSALILPGSAGAIGGQAFAIKLRPTAERSTTSLLIEPPFELVSNGSHAGEVDSGAPPRWRHIKHACGENPSNVYAGTRMDTVWSYREAYASALALKNSQDAYCTRARAGEWKGLNGAAFPEDLKWEALADVLRGKVKVQTHCYEAVDFDAFVRLSNEFQFPIAAFHHAHEAYLVPDVLKRAYGDEPPAIAMFASFSRYKREAYRHSEFAPRILHDNGLKVIMKSDHSAVVSRYLLHEAQQAHYFGLPADVALASVTSTPADIMGLGHRLGHIREGYDADIVIFDSHPLALGATPIQVFIDGIAQISDAHSLPVPKPQSSPTPPDFAAERVSVLEYTGLPPLEPALSTTGTVVFRNVSSLWTRRAGVDIGGVDEVFQSGSSEDGEAVVVVRDGQVVCIGRETGTCAGDLAMISLETDTHGTASTIIDLRGGSIAPALVAAGTALGLQEIQAEPSTADGAVWDVFDDKSKQGIIRAVDGLQYATRDAQLAYRAGVTSAVVAPVSYGLLAGLSTHFALGAAHKLERGAVIQDVLAVHVAIGHKDVEVPSVSTQIAALRQLLLHEQGEPKERGRWFKEVTQGKIPLVVEVTNADIMATLLGLKQEVEAFSGVPMRMTFLKATEAHLLASEIAEAGVGVVVIPPRSFPYTWEEQRFLYGPPVMEDSLVSMLFAHNVTVAIGPQGVLHDTTMTNWATRNLRWDAGWVSLDSHGRIGIADALAMVSTNVETLLGARGEAANSDLVATSSGELLSFEGKVAAVISPRRGRVDIF